MKKPWKDESTSQVLQFRSGHEMSQVNGPKRSPGQFSVRRIKTVTTPSTLVDKPGLQPAAQASQDALKFRVWSLAQWLDIIMRKLV